MRHALFAAELAAKRLAGASVRGLRTTALVAIDPVGALPDIEEPVSDRKSKFGVFHVPAAKTAAMAAAHVVSATTTDTKKPAGGEFAQYCTQNAGHAPGLK